MDMIRTHLANHIRASSREQWLHQQARHMTASDRHRRHANSALDAGAPSTHGYFWWTGDVDWQGKKLPWSAAVGNGGQRLFLVPALDLVVVMTAGAYNDSGIAAKEGDLLKQVVATVQSQ